MTPLSPFDGLHLDEVTASAAADGQIELLSEEALAHLEACPDCALLVANFATRTVELALVLGAAARDVAPEVAATTPDSVRPKQPFPLAVVLAAALLAMLGMAPTVFGHDPTASLSAVPDLVRAALAVADIPRSSSVNLALELGAAVMLASLGLWIATPRSVKGVVR